MPFLRSGSTTGVGVAGLFVAVGARVAVGFIVAVGLLVARETPWAIRVSVGRSTTVFVAGIAVI